MISQVLKIYWSYAIIYIDGKFIFYAVRISEGIDSEMQKNFGGHNETDYYFGTDVPDGGAFQKLQTGCSPLLEEKLKQIAR